MIEDTIKSNSVEEIDSSVKVNGIGRISILSEDKGLVQETTAPRIPIWSPTVVLTR